MSTEARGTRPRKAAGPERPSYFDTADIDRVMAILLALVSEVASIRDRLDTHERIAATGAVPGIEPVETYVPDAATEDSREAWRDGYIRRLFRVITDDVDAMRIAAASAPHYDEPVCSQPTG